MAKSSKPTPRPASVSAKPKAPPLPRPVALRSSTDWLARPAVEANPLLRKIFWGVALFGLVMLVGLSFGSGINADDKFQVDYSQKLVNYYGTFGRDTAALNIPEGNMHLYGGAFEIVRIEPITAAAGRIVLCRLLGEPLKLTFKLSPAGPPRIQKYAEIDDD